MGCDWQDIAMYVQEVHSKEGSRPNPGFYRLLGNQALHIIAVETGMICKAWDNQPGGLILDGNFCQLPSECILVTSVEWDGEALSFRQGDQLDRENPGWRTQVGSRPSCYTKTGTQVLLDCAAVGNIEGKLVVRGISVFPVFSDDASDPNPLELLPARFQLLPAYYILANLPVKSANQSEVERRNRYESMWKSELLALTDCIESRKWEKAGV